MVLREEDYYDLTACLQYNPQEGFTYNDIAEVLANAEGENDERDWVWILRLNNTKFIFLQGGCDYTGWDCQSGASSQFIDNPENGVDLVTGYNVGWVEETKASLREQLANGRSETWREVKNKEFGI